MQGFRDFLLKGNLVELAVAFIMATAFAAVVTTFTDVMMGFVGKVGGEPNFDRSSSPMSSSGSSSPRWSRS